MLALKLFLSISVFPTSLSNEEVTSGALVPVIYASPPWYQSLLHRPPKSAIGDAV